MGDVQVNAAELDMLHKKYPTHVCVFVQKSVRSHDMPPLDKHKYLVPKDMTIGIFMYTIRKRMKLPSDKALFLFVGDTLPTTSSTLGEIYSMHGRDGYLKILYTGESTFGYKH